MNEETLFVEALEKQGSERGAFLDEHCKDNVELRKRLESLLRAHDQPDPFLEPAALVAVGHQSPAEGPGTVIGPYKLIEQIDEGGFGAADAKTVFVHDRLVGYYVEVGSCDKAETHLNAWPGSGAKRPDGVAPPVDPVEKSSRFRLQQLEYAKAEPLLLEAYTGLKQHEIKNAAAAKPRVVEALQRLVQLYDGWGKKALAEEWRQKLKKA